MSKQQVRMGIQTN